MTTAVPTELAANRLLTVHEFAAAARISRATVYKLLASGDLASVKVHKCRRIPLASARKFLDGLVGGQLPTGDEAGDSTPPRHNGVPQRVAVRGREKPDEPTADGDAA